MKKLITLIAIVAIAVGGCKKPKDGEQGPAGKDGNANVTSLIQSTSSSSWTWDATNSYSYATISFSGITSAIANTGAVLVYAEGTPTGTGVWGALPRVVYPYSSSTYSQSQRFIYSPGSVKIIIQDSDWTQPTSAIVSGSQSWKIVAIASSRIAQHPEVDFSNYEQVKKVFNLQD